jgi:predicted DNA-binding mobile mystery protein A
MTIFRLSSIDWLRMRDKENNPGIEQLDSVLAGFHAARSAPRPAQGWIRAIREALGVSSGELGRILGVSRQLPLQFEKAEAEDSITLKSLRAVANALDCDLVYALAPRAGSLRQLAELRAGTRKEVAPSPVRKQRTVRRIEAVETPAIEDEGANLYFCD